MTDIDHDVVVAGASPGGIATAVRAAREGCDVSLVTYNDHLGGMMAGGLSYTDTTIQRARTPLFASFRQRVRDHYRDSYGPDSDQLAHTEDGYIFEPHVAENTFEAMVEQTESLSVVRGYAPTAVERANARLRRVHFEPVGEGDTGLSLSAHVFVDATYEGDLLAAAGTAYRVGREARRDHDEQFAGRLYTGVRGDRFYPRVAVGPGDDSAPADRRGPLDVPPDKRGGDLDVVPHPAGLTELYPKSTGEGDDAIQAYNYRLCLSRDPETRRYPERPPGYDREEFLDVLEDIRDKRLRSYLLLRYLPNDKADMNSADLPGTNHDYPEAGRERRREIATRHREYALGLLYFLQNDEAVPDEVRSAAREWGLATDEFTDTDNFPWQLYVREARRLDGRMTFTESDARHAPGLDRTPVHDDAIAIAEYPLDSHACHEDRQLGSQREGFFFASQVTRPSQVPYRALLPKDLDNLLVPVPLSATHVGYGTIRLEPTWLHIGEATGFAAAQALETERPPADIDTDALQRTLAQRGVMISFFNGVAMDDEHSWLPAVQYLGTKGYFHSYDARPDEPLDAGLARAWADRTAALLDEDAAEATAFARQVADYEDGQATDTVSTDDFVALLDEALACRDLDESVPDAGSVSSGAPLTRGGACEVMYGLLDS